MVMANKSVNGVTDLVVRIDEILFGLTVSTNAMVAYLGAPSAAAVDAVEHVQVLLVMVISIVYNTQKALYLLWDRGAS